MERGDERYEDPTTSEWRLHPPQKCPSNISISNDLPHLPPRPRPLMCMCMTAHTLSAVPIQGISRGFAPPLASSANNSLSLLPSQISTVMAFNMASHRHPHRMRLSIVKQSCGRG
ncbi:uncharacterized protein LACBIDRAFT_310632 [Laccaria bicolor S238N-H82]|uniref:Predicted protein n=1 Tax=Laccaria bicolor (strain S238N-H82 / ATCC MYA-4686) TaxID=486041 RepID=B0DUS1_LACBS|nr:uncharacterized protein LACBIDRAFT_310632 [Laccaria bicolor S238N-H82]EDR01661.1 predicted protein [Laccaria bicolor S238N-H82]|eukprot:XP_001887737.1 predicted protein [Laccaria bicolor S238N-H82]